MVAPTFIAISAMGAPAWMTMTLAMPMMSAGAIGVISGMIAAIILGTITTMSATTWKTVVVLFQLVSKSHLQCFFLSDRYRKSPI